MTTLRPDRARGAYPHAQPGGGGGGAGRGGPTPRSNTAPPRRSPAFSSPPPTRPRPSNTASGNRKQVGGDGGMNGASGYGEGDGWVINSLKARMFSLEEQARQMGGGKVLAEFRELQRETQRENQILREALARAQAEGDALRNRLAAHEARLQALEHGQGSVDGTPRGMGLASRAEGGVEGLRAQLVEVEEGLLQHLRNVAARFQSLDDALEEVRGLSRRELAEVDGRLAAMDDRLSLLTQQQKLVVMGIQNQLQVDLQPFIESASAELSLSRRPTDFSGRSPGHPPALAPRHLGHDRLDASHIENPLQHRAAYENRLHATEESMNALQQRIATLHKAARPLEHIDHTPVRSPL